MSRSLFFQMVCMAIIGMGLFIPLARADSSAAVFMYHRFGEGEYPSTSIRLDQFEQHLQYLTDNGFNVWPVPKIIETLQEGKELPPNTVGITVDDAFLSVYKEAWPRFRRYKMPFTLFVSTDAIDQGKLGYMTWSQLRELSRQGVTIGSQTASHPHMISLKAEQVRAEISSSSARLEKELGSKPTLFAYPYGEYSAATKKLIEESGFLAAFGQQSGAFDSGSDMFALPRYALNEQFGDMERFRLAANTIALPAKDIVPSDPVIESATNPPAFGFTLERKVGSLTSLNCFGPDGQKAEITLLGDSRVEVRLPIPLPLGRARLNCTMPAGGGKWYWLGQQFYVKGGGSNRADTATN